MDIDSKAKKELDNLFVALSITASGKYVFLTDLRYDYSRWSKKAVDLFGLPGEYMVSAGKIWESHIWVLLTVMT